jgi:hypothetical protein
LGQLGGHEIIEKLIETHWNMLGTPKSFKMSNCPPPLTHSVFVLVENFCHFAKKRGPATSTSIFLKKKFKFH